MSPSFLLLYSNRSLTGWGSHLNLTAAGVWFREEGDLHINVLEMKAVQLALNTFLDSLAGKSVVVMSDNNMVAYRKEQGVHHVGGDA